MGNIFLGIIVDAFADLRDKKQAYEEDSNNVCYICQLTRDKSTSNLIDFDKHIEQVHSPWRYVDFITYLLISDQKKIRRMEIFAYQKIKEHDITWIPYFSPKETKYD
jgi:hypothetical protein